MELFADVKNLGMLQRYKRPSYSERLCSMNPNIDQNLLELKSFCRKSSGGLKILRCIFVIMRKIGIKEKLISKILDFCDRTKEKCWNRYLEKGIAGLEDLNRCGRPPKINIHQEKEIFKFVESSANKESTSKITTIYKIKEKIQNEFNLKYSYSGIYKIMHRIGLSKISPRPLHIKNEKEKMNAWMKELDQKIKTISDNFDNKKIEIYFQDETRYGQKTISTGIWAPTGSSPIYKNENGFLNSWIYGAINPINGNKFGYVLPALNSSNMNIFINEFSKQIPKENHVIMILDGSRAHNNNIISIPNNISFIYLPPYSPQLNPIERLWGWIKKTSLSFKTYANYDEIIDAGIDAWRKITPEIVKSVCACDYLLN